MKKIVLFILLALVLSPLNSCKKDEEPDPPTKTELLTDGIWDGVSLEEYLNGVLDYTELIPEYQFDFKTDNTFLSFENGVQDYSSTWSFSTDETKLIIDGEINTIETLTDTSLILSYIEIDGGDTYKEVITLKR